MVVDPCNPSPCGPNAECRVNNDVAACSCIQNYIGRPPNCRPECTQNSQCLRNQACVGNKCVDPCEGVCAPNAECSVKNHSPMCNCPPGFTGDPFRQCIEFGKHETQYTIVKQIFAAECKALFQFRFFLVDFAKLLFFKKY